MRLVGKTPNKALKTDAIDSAPVAPLSLALHIAATRQSINIRVVYITTEDKGYVQSSHTKSVCLLL
jgi:hypothetical protein